MVLYNTKLYEAKMYYMENDKILYAPVCLVHQRVSVAMYHSVSVYHCANVMVCPCSSVSCASVPEFVCSM